MKYIVLQQFYDAKSLRLVKAGSMVDWEDKERIESAIKRGLIEEIKETKTPAKKKTAPKKK